MTLDEIKRLIEFGSYRGVRLRRNVSVNLCDDLFRRGGAGAYRLQNISFALEPV